MLLGFGNIWVGEDENFLMPFSHFFRLVHTDILAQRFEQRNRFTNITESNTKFQHEIEMDNRQKVNGSTKYKVGKNTFFSFLSW